MQNPIRHKAPCLRLWHYEAKFQSLRTLSFQRITHILGCTEIVPTEDEVDIPKECRVAMKIQSLQSVTDTCEITWSVFNKPAATIKDSNTSPIENVLSTTLVFTT